MITSLEREILAAAHAEAKKIVNSAVAESKKIVSHAIEQSRHELLQREKLMKKNIDQSFDRDLRRHTSKLEAAISLQEQHLIDSVYDTAIARLNSNPSKILKLLLDKATPMLDAPKTAFVRSEDMSIMKSLTRLDVKPKNISGGLVLENEQHNQSIDFSFEALLPIVKEQTLPDVKKTLTPPK